MRRHLLTAIAAAALLSGCTAISNMRNSDASVRDNTDAADAALAALRNGTPTVAPSAVRILDDDIYIPPAAKQTTNERSLPTRCDITFAPAAAVTVLEFGQTVTKVCGLQIRVTPDAITATQGAGGTSAPAASTDPVVRGIPLPDGVQLPPLLAGGSVNAVPTATQRYGRISIRYEGDVAGLLSAATAPLGLSWRYRDGIVTIFHLDTRFFPIHTIPTSTQMQSVVSSGSSVASGSSGGASGGGGAGGGSSTSGGIGGASTSSQATNISFSTNPSQDLTNTIASMLTPNLGRMSLSPSSGGVSVTDTPDVLSRVESYIEHLNNFATKQVLLNVKILTVKINDSDELGIDWNLVYTSLADQYGIGLVGAAGTSENAVSGSVNILEGSSRFSGSRLLVNALSKQGRVSVLKQPSATTLNLEPVTLQIAHQSGFLASSQTTLVADVGAATSLTAGTVTAGFNISLLPYILDDSRTILLQLSAILNSHDGVRRVESGGSAIEIPEGDLSIMSQKVRIRSGETLVLSGFEESTTSRGRSGAGSPWFWLLGGGANASNDREVLVLLITPIVTK